MKLELFRLAPKGGIKIETVKNGGGNLKCGSYQFSFRLVNDVNGKTTKFSPFTNTISISSVNNLGDQNGAVNTFSNKSIVLSISVTKEEIDLYTSIQIGVIENNSGQSGYTNAVSIIQSIRINGESNSFEYTFNDRINVLDIAEVVIDDAPVKTSKSLATKNNRLVLGNITYKNLLFDNGDPYISTGSIHERKTPVVGSTDKSSLESKGYFSDEVYRFYVTFWDEYGDYSLPIALDMSNVVGNAIDENLEFKDMKFPKRSSSYKFIDVENKGTDQEAVYSINRGIQITVRNIPSWAKGMSILRAKRKKNILFQSPLIPTTIVQSPDAQGDYPGEGRQAPSPLGTIMPKNMNLSLNKAITRRPATTGFTRDQVDWSANYEGFDFCKNIHVAYPPEVLFNNSGVPYMDYIKNSNLYIESIDYCMLAEGNDRLLSRNTSINSGVDHSNDSQRSSASNTLASKPYYYASDRIDRSTFNSQIENTGRKVNDIVKSFNVIPSGTEGVPIIGIPNGSPTSNFAAYGDLEIQPSSPANGVRPSNQKCVVITTQGERPDLSYYGVSGASGYDTSVVVSAKDQNDNVIVIDETRVKPVTGQNSNPYWGTSNHFIEIVNFKAGLSDSRYGSPNSQMDIVSTGAAVSFEQAPEFVSLVVFGGDCYISPFTFKVHDSHYAVVNSGLWGDTADAWGGESFKADNKELRRPMPYRSMAASIGVYLESEVNSLFSEEFLTKGNEDVYNPTTPIVYPFSGSTVFGRFYNYNGNIYRAMVQGSSISNPGSNLTSHINSVNNIGYLFEDFGKSITGVFYNYRRPIDLFYTNNSFAEAKAPMNYLYNPEYSLEDYSKPFPFVYDSNNFVRTKFGSRLAYSDVKISQIINDGFSRIRVANIYDVDESKGDITKVIEDSGRLYAIQERGFCYVPFEANIMETVDGTTLAIQSGQIVGIPQYIENYGSRHIRSVASTPAGLTFTDVDNSKIILFSGSLSHLNDLGISRFIEDKTKALRPLKTSDKDIQTYFDYNRDEVVYKFNNEAIVYDIKAGNIKTRIEHGSPFVDWMYGLYHESGHYIIGYNWLEENTYKNQLILSQINSADNLDKEMLGVPFGSSYKFVINDKPYFNKMFYLIKFMSEGTEGAKITAYKNGVEKSSYSSPTVADRRAGYLLNMIRDSSDLRRLRGDYALVESSLLNNQVTMAITKIQGSYRLL